MAAAWRCWLRFACFSTAIPPNTSIPMSLKHHCMRTCCRASSFSTSIFSPPHSNAQRTYSNAAGGAAATPSTATPRHLASATADAAGTSPNIAGITACLDLPHLSPHLASHHAPHQPFTRRVLSFNVWTGDAPEAAVIHPMNAPGAGVAGMPQVQAQAPGASNGGCWWLPSPATTPTAGSARGEAAPNPTFRAASPMRPAPSHGYSPRLTGLGLPAYSPAAPSNSTGVPDRMVTGRVALLRAPQSQQGRDSHSQMLQEAAAEVHAGRPRAFLAAAHQLLELARRTQHSGGGGAVAGGAQAQGPGEVPLGAALPWALPGRGLSIRTHPQQAISSTSVMSAHATQAPLEATQRPTAAVSAAAAATATHVHLGLPLLSISAVGATSSGLGSAADALRSAAARQSPTGTLAITPGVWRLAGAKPAPANSGAPTTVSAVSAAASPPAAPSPAMRPGVEGLDDVEEVESPARRFPVAAHWEAAEAEPADSTPRATPRAAAPAAAAAPHSTPRAPASGTPVRRSFFSPTASSCGAVGGAADTTPSWAMASPAGVSVAGGATLTEPARSAAASGGGSGGVPGSATPVSQLQRPSRFASVRRTDWALLVRCSAPAQPTAPASRLHGLRYPGSLQMCLAHGMLAVLDPDPSPRCPLLALSSPCRAVPTCVISVHHQYAPLPYCPSATLTTVLLPYASLPYIPHLTHCPLSHCRCASTAPPSCASSWPRHWPAWQTATPIRPALKTATTPTPQEGLGRSTPLPLRLPHRLPRMRPRLHPWWRRRQWSAAQTLG